MRAEESVPVDDLVAYALFDIDPNIRRAHRPLFFFLVSLALLRAQNHLDADAVHDAVCDQMPTEQTLSRDDVDAAISSGVANGLVLIDDKDAYFLSDLREKQLNDARRALLNSEPCSTNIWGELSESEELTGSTKRASLRNLSLASKAS